jgi:hypothetical protein
MATIETGQIDFIVIASLVGLFMSKDNKRSTVCDILIMPAPAGHGLPTFVVG